jgi:hypothetical protein
VKLEVKDFDRLKKLREAGTTYTSMLGKELKGYVGDNGKPLKLEELSKFMRKHGHRIYKKTKRKGGGLQLSSAKPPTSANLENDVLEVMGSKLSVDLKKKFLSILIN